MVTGGDVVWAVDPFRPGTADPRPWLVVSRDSLPFGDEEAIGVACTTQSHHQESLAVPSDAWETGEPETRSHVLPWSVATLKNDRHVIGRQGRLDEEFVAEVVAALISYLVSPVAGRSC